MIMPPLIQEQFNINTDINENDYYRHALIDFGRMTDVYEGKTSYICSDMSTLAKTLERFYKGAIEIKMKENPDFQIRQGNLRSIGHNLKNLVITLENLTGWKMFDYSKKNSYRDRDIFLNDLKSEYEDSSYRTYPTFEDFKIAYITVASQKELLEEYLKPRQRDNDKINEGEER